MSILPLYHRVFLSLRDQIVNGVYDWRKPMPGEVQLATELKVSRATVRHALELLEEEGLIIRKQGAGTFAKALGVDKAGLRSNLDLLSQKSRHLDLLPGGVNLRHEMVTSDKSLAKQFADQAKLYRAVRVRESAGKPYCFIATYLPLPIADCIDWDALGSKPVITACVEAGYNYVKVEQSITATVADTETAAGMHVPIGSPLLLISGLFIDSEGLCVMRKDGFFHPDSFEFKTTIYNTAD